MTVPKQIPDMGFVAIAFIVAILVAILIQGIAGKWTPVVFFIALFFVLYLFALLRGWSARSRFPVVGSSKLSELFLGLALIASAIAISGFLGVMIGRTYTDIDGVLSSLCIFGVLTLVISLSRNWQ